MSWQPKSSCTILRIFLPPSSRSSACVAWYPTVPRVFTWTCKRCNTMSLRGRLMSQRCSAAGTYEPIVSPTPPKQIWRASALGTPSSRPLLLVASEARAGGRMSTSVLPVGQRMRFLLSNLDKIPQGLLLVPGPRMQQKGWGWAVTRFGSPGLKNSVTAPINDASLSDADQFKTTPEEDAVDSCYCLVYYDSQQSATRAGGAMAAAIVSVPRNMLRQLKDLDVKVFCTWKGLCQARALNVDLLPGDKSQSDTLGQLKPEASWENDVVWMIPKRRWIIQ
ncbi:hypothetical protein B0T17DRAFT_638030 [Bombardia bombarda]|uniref:Uncharacterized protein n=1 Tax=Bombardia bombarda TaxID=252184 RepID=A0AA39XC26_9PEZI|nr:hypothetical protein B0T17DRAFT_638030 [Bombardia bombarda]